MLYNVIFSNEAEETFFLIGQQLADRFGEKELSEYRRRVYEVVESISKFPFIFKAVGEDENLRKACIHRNCSMLYDIGKSRV